jgi:hypothetical protein
MGSTLEAAVAAPGAAGQLALSVASLSWAPGQRLASLTALSAAVRALVAHDVAYYRARQRRSRRLGFCCRLAAVGLGALGALVPLMEQLWGQTACWQARLAWLSGTGQFWLMLAGLALVVDTVWAGTQAHVRYTSTVMALEAGLARWSLDWQRQLAALQGAEPDAGQLEGLLRCAQQMVETHHALQSTEADQWRQAMVQAQEKAARPTP